MDKQFLRPPAGTAPTASSICQAACVMTDAEGYTGVAEGMKPIDLVGFVNGYFRALFGAVLRNGGAVMDVKGDGILAVWTDAFPRSRVCSGCIEMIEATGPLGRSRPARRLPTRIGVDYGPVALANVGAYSCYEFRAVGDTVNTCSRLQELNKLLGTRILVSQPFADGVGDFLFRDLGDFTLRGKRAALRVFELMATQGRATRRQRVLCESFAEALAAFEARRVADAMSRFNDLCTRFPQDGPSRYYLAQCLERRHREAGGTAIWRNPLENFALQPRAFA